MLPARELHALAAIVKESSPEAVEQSQHEARACARVHVE